MSGYKEALEAAGHKILAFKSFGNYQGTWYAITSDGIITGWFGSCSFCDAFESEFGYKTPTQEELVAFGKRYGDPQPIQKVISDLMKAKSYDYEAENVLEWLVSFSGKDESGFKA